MRKVIVGAIQPPGAPYDPRFDCLQPGYTGDAKAVLRDYVSPYLETSLRLIVQAGEAGCDIVTTSEDACGLSRFLVDTTSTNTFPALVAASAALADQAFSTLAKRYGMYVLACYFRPEGTAVYNTATLFDRDGIQVGAYRKTHLPPDELWQVCPGDVLNVLDVDFGRIGVSICYDIMFPESVAVLALRGAQIIFHPTGGYGWYDAIGEATLRTRANDNGVHIVTAKNYVLNGAGHSSVIDHWGQVLADAGFYENVMVCHALDLDVPKTQPDWFYPSRMSGTPRVAERKLTERRPDLYGDLIAPCAAPQRAPDAVRQAELREMIRQGRCRWG